MLNDEGQFLVYRCKHLYKKRKKRTNKKNKRSA